MGDKIGLLDLEFVKNTRDIVALRFLVIAIFGVRREAHPPQVRSDDRVIVHQRRCQGSPHVSRVAEAVQHNDGWPFTANPDVNRRAISFDLFDAETGRESGNFCHAVLSTTGTLSMAALGPVTGFAGLDNRPPLQLVLTMRLAL